MKIIVQRNSIGPDLWRSYWVVVNNASKKLRNSDSVTFEVEKGQASMMHMKIDWIKSETFILDRTELDNDLQLKVDVNPKVSFCILGMVAGVMLWDITQFLIFAWIGMLAFAGLLYFYTIGRRYYFKVKLSA